MVSADGQKLAVPWGGAHNLGQGIGMAVSAGAATHRMHEGCAKTSINSRAQTLSGVVVNAAAQRFIAEDASPGVLGGLHTTVGGQVVNGCGEVIDGLYAVGRSAAGLPSAPYYAEGLSLADCTYFGRRACQYAVLQRVSV